MKVSTTLVIAFIMLISNGLCIGQSTKKKDESPKKTANIQVYYFHFSRRCQTCIAVEENAKKALDALYAEKVKNGEYSFKALNLDDKTTKTTAEKFGIGGQTLLIVCGNKTLDITDKGFMNAHDFDKMKIDIKKAIEKALKG
jgi:hypothetical protein